MRIKLGDFEIEIGLFELVFVGGIIVAIIEILKA